LPIVSPRYSPSQSSKLFGEALMSLTAGYRVRHISNDGTRSPNSGLNFGLPFIGLSYQGF
jgi:hypothetical protein